MNRKEFGLSLLQMFVVIALLAIFSMPSFASADTLVKTCGAATQPGGTGPVSSDSTFCSIPSGTTITRATLSYKLDDGGEVKINGEEVFGIAPDLGIDTGTIELSTNLFSGQSSFHVEVTARNAMYDDGTLAGEIYGEAIIKLYTSTQQSYCANGSTLTRAEFSRAMNEGKITLHEISISGSTATFRVDNTTGCTAPLSLSSYKMFDGVLSHQELFDKTGPTQIGSGSLNVDLPNCKAQIDAWFGSAPTTLLDSNPYGDANNEFWVIKWAGSSLPLCTHTQPPTNNLPTVTIWADDTSIDEGDSTTVHWTSTNATSCTGTGGANGWAASRATGTDRTFNTGSLTSDKTFGITCFNSFGQDSDSVTIGVDGDNTDNSFDVSCRANPRTATVGERVHWIASTDGVSESRVDFDWSKDANGNDEDVTETYNRAGTYEAKVRAEYNGEVETDTCEVRVENGINRIPLPTPQLPTVALYADSTNIAYNAATTIHWGTSNATSCTASGGSLGWAGPKNIGPGSFYTGSLTSLKTYTLTCWNSFGSAKDSVTVNVRGRVLGVTTTRPPLSSYVLITSSIDRNQPIVPTLDNTRPHPGDEINYTVTYQNIGNGAVTNLTLRLDLPYEVMYMFSNPANPIIAGNTLIFNLGTLKANGQGTVTVRVRVRDNVAPGTVLNFPAVLTYTDPAGYPQSVSANVSARVWDGPEVMVEENPQPQVLLGANVFGAGSFLPSTLFGWLLLLVLILLLVLLVKHIFNPPVVRERITHVEH